MSCITAISYWIGLPFWWEKSPTTAVALLIFGNWLMINCGFHYYMGIVCDPGCPPEVRVNLFFIFSRCLTILSFFCNIIVLFAEYVFRIRR